MTGYRNHRREDQDEYPEGETSTSGWWDRKAARMEQDLAETREYAASPEGKLESLRKRYEAMRFAHVDCGMYTGEEISQVWEQYQALEAEISKAKVAEIEARQSVDGPVDQWDILFCERGGWTKETTQARREGWNTLVKAGELSYNSNPKMGIDPSKLAARQKEQGWTTSDLRRAVDIWDLS